MEETYPISGFESLQGRRPTMEDTHVMIDDVSSSYPSVRSKTSYYGVYDGHGGREAAALCEKLLHENLLTDESISDGDITTAIRDAFFKTDKTILETSVTEGWNSGSTAVLSVVTPHHIFVADVGDSEAVLGKRTENGYEAILLSTKHKPSGNDEKERIKKAGGHVVFGRVMGSLAVSRSLGDRSFKYPYNKAEADFVSCEPHVNKIDLLPEHEFLIFACDGLWDKMTYEKAVEMVALSRDGGKKPSETAQDLAKESLDKGSMDNVTVIVIYLSPHIPQKRNPEVKTDSKEDDVDKKTNTPSQLNGFDLPSDEAVLFEFTCNLEKKKVKNKGTMLITQNYICFYSAKPVFGRIVRESCAIADIETIEKKKSLLGFVNAIQITCKDGRKFYYSWKTRADERDAVFSKLLELISKMDARKSQIASSASHNVLPVSVKPVAGNKSNSEVDLAKSSPEIDRPSNSSSNNDGGSKMEDEPKEKDTKDAKNNETATHPPLSSSHSGEQESPLRLSYQNWSRQD